MLYARGTKANAMGIHGVVAVEYTLMQGGRHRVKSVLLGDKSWYTCDPVVSMIEGKGGTRNTCATMPPIASMMPNTLLSLSGLWL